MNEQYLRPEQACRILSISSRTLFAWEQQGKLKSIRTKGGHRRYLKQDIVEHKNPSTKPLTQHSYCYCRVSTPSQRDDLRRQVEYFENRFPDHIIITDIGSGINFKRKGLKTILDRAIKGDIRELVVTHRDRLCRFGFELYQDIISTYSNGSILVLDQRETSPEQELVDDILSIITVFSSRLYGLRSHKIKNKIKEACNGKNGKDAQNNEV